MKKRGMKYAFVSLILVVAILLSPVAPVIRLHQLTMLWEKMVNATPAQAEGPEGSTIYLPLLTTPPGPPAFEIISPASGEPSAASCTLPCSRLIWRALNV